MSAHDTVRDPEGLQQGAPSDERFEFPWEDQLDQMPVLGTARICLMRGPTFCSMKFTRDVCGCARQRPVSGEGASAAGMAGAFARRGNPACLLVPGI